MKLPIQNYFYTPSFRTIEVEGNDKCSFLNNLSTEDISNIKNGSGKITLFLKSNGKILCLSFVYQIEDKILIASPEIGSENLTSYLDYYHIREDVKFREVDSSAFKYKLQMGTPIDKSDGRLILSKNGISLRIGSEMKDSEGNWDTYRFYFGYPEYNIEYSDKDYPHECGLSEFVNFNKGCFVGQEPVAKMEHKSPPTRKITNIRLNKRLDPGAKLLCKNEFAGKIVSISNDSIGGNFYAFAKIKTAYLNDPENVLFEGENGEIINIHNRPGI